MSDEQDGVSELVGANTQLLSILYDDPNATQFLKGLYKNVYLIKETINSLENVSVSITFIEDKDGTIHQGGFELILSADTGEGRRWIIKQLY